MDTQTNLAFHAGARFVYIPDATARTILQYADRQSVDFIVVRPFHPWVAGRHALEAWGRDGIDDPRATLVYAAQSGSPSERLLIYRWRRDHPSVAAR